MQRLTLCITFLCYFIDMTLLIRNWFFFFLTGANLRAFLAGITKITTEKVQIFILTTQFSIHTSANSLFYLNIILCEKQCERKRERDSERRKEKERENNNNKTL